MSSDYNVNNNNNYYHHMTIRLSENTGNLSINIEEEKNRFGKFCNTYMKSLSHTSQDKYNNFKILNYNYLSFQIDGEWQPWSGNVLKETNDYDDNKLNIKDLPQEICKTANSVVGFWKASRIKKNGESYQLKTDPFTSHNYISRTLEDVSLDPNRTRGYPKRISEPAGYGHNEENQIEENSLKNDIDEIELASPIPYKEFEKIVREQVTNVTHSFPEADLQEDIKFYNELLGKGPACTGVYVEHPVTKNNVFLTIHDRFYGQDIEDWHAVFGFNDHEIKNHQVTRQDDQINIQLDAKHVVPRLKIESSTYFKDHNDRASSSLKDCLADAGVTIFKVLQSRYSKTIPVDEKWTPAQCYMEDLKPGQEIYTISHSHGLSMKYSKGKILNTSETNSNWYPTDLLLDPQSAGAPVFDAASHKLIGIMGKSLLGDFVLNGDNGKLVPFQVPREYRVQYGFGEQFLSIKAILNLNHSSDTKGLL